MQKFVTLRYDSGEMLYYYDEAKFHGSEDSAYMLWEVHI